MSYTKQHLRLIVRALALTGSPIGALRWLARNSLELGHIRLKTLRKFSKRPDIAKLVAKESRLIEQALQIKEQSELLNPCIAQINELEALNSELLHWLQNSSRSGWMTRKEKISFWQKIQDALSKLRTQKNRDLEKGFESSAPLHPLDTKLSQTKASAAPKESSRPGRLDENAKTELVEKFSKLKDMLKTIQSPDLHDDKDKPNNNLDAENKKTELA
jgi:hypothetical protein